MDKTIYLKKVSESFNNENRDRLDSVTKKLNYKAGDQIKVFAIFSVDEEGNIVDIKACSVHPEFEKEAIRILSELPKMPTQKYSLPIAYMINNIKAH